MTASDGIEDSYFSLNQWNSSSKSFLQPLNHKKSAQLLVYAHVTEDTNNKPHWRSEKTCATYLIKWVILGIISCLKFKE